MTALRHLVHLLRGQWFRRLFAVRVASQLTDGVFQVALAAYVVFSPERQPGPGAIASALAVVLLPFSVLGPFVGVFLDRWSRRQVLALSNFVRVGLVGVLAFGVHEDLHGPALFALILASLSVNRFLLAGLSASLPHVVERGDLVTANALTPTAGTLAFLIGLGLGTGARIGWERLGADSDVGVLVTAAALYAVAGSLALRIPRHMLGPDLDQARPAVREAVRHVARGLVAGVRHLGERRPAAYALTAIGAHRFFYGISTVALILLYRNYFHDTSEVGRGVHRAVGGDPGQRHRLRDRGRAHARRHRADPAAHVGAHPARRGGGGAAVPRRSLHRAGAAGHGVLPRRGLAGHQDRRGHAGADPGGRRLPRPGVLAVRRDLQRGVRRGRRRRRLVLPVDGKSYAVLVSLAVGYLVTAVWYARVTR